MKPESGTNSNFRLVNNVAGWAVFGIAASVYLITVEDTASFWDCGEFIACAYKLEVPHPPGAPFFLLFNRIFSMLAHDVYHVAFWVNVSSALCSAFTILFMFWSITLLGIKLLPGASPQNITSAQLIPLMGAGFVGSLAYTFSDSFWFSAVEAEVYAMSSLFTAFVVWAMLRWELIEDDSAANRWLIMIAYTMGLSIGVHLLNLVTIPALGLIYYYKKYTVHTQWGLLLALAISGAIIIVILEGVIPGLPSLAGNFEIFFVNSLGLPFGAGISFISVLLVGGLVYGIYYTQTKGKVLANTTLLSLAFILIGYASYGIVLIRANYNPPINENDPSDIIKFVSYLKREQYGDRPLFYGPTFNSDVKRTSDGAPVQISKGKLYRMNREKGIYELYDERKAYVYDDNLLFPRIYSRQDNHREIYIRKLYGADRELPEGFKPSMGDNLFFFFTDQLGRMYFRYFFWNFVGRESDLEGAGGLSPLANSQGLPEVLAQNAGRNQYYALPLLLGLLGLAYVYMRSRPVFLITLLLFFLTGIALVLYLNLPPVEPRERDYIYVGSFYVFAMWIGLGVMFLAEIFTRFGSNLQIAGINALALGLIVPGIMVVENWDDHDRSNRYHSVDSAKNLLNSCAPNAILFTGGDNDTFPLWYVQEVEGFRTDVRVCNLSLLGTDWYIDQMKRATYQSAALPISLPSESYTTGKNDQILYPKAWRITPNLAPDVLEDLDKKGMDLKAYLELLAKNDNRIRAVIGGGESEEEISIFPSQKLKLKVDAEKVRKMGFVPKDKLPLLKNYLEWNLRRNDLYKSDLIMLDIIASNNWERPIYFSTTLGNSSYLDLREFMQREGLALRLMPFRVVGANQGFTNTEIMYKNLTERFYYRELNNPNSYYDENYQRFTINLRKAFVELAQGLLEEGKAEKAKKVVAFCLAKIPDQVIPYDVYSVDFVDVLFRVKQSKKAQEIAGVMGRRADEMLRYQANREAPDEVEVSTNLHILQRLSLIMEENKQSKEAKKFKDMLEIHYNKLAL
ncbi:MAG: DUF2723 domain-containing protein [Microscillaceae bacterium]|nr:DUF2723 domain-containing protein [Microscillaceae bacterium]